MAWRTIDGREYYYTSIRVDGQPRSVYVGKADDDLPGEVAREIVRDIRRRARRRERARREAEERRAELERLRSVLELGATLERLVLESLGYHRPDRHWRRKRMSKTLVKSPAGPLSPVPAENEARRKALVIRLSAKMNAISEQIRSGDHAKLLEARAMFGAMDDSTLDHLGSTARRAEEALVAATYVDDPLLAEAAREKLARVRDELAGADPSPAERLLAERAAFCWMAVNSYEAIFAQARGLSLEQSAHQQRRIDLAHRRFVGAIKALALVRRLAVPAMLTQVNVATQQAIVNRVASAEKSALDGDGVRIAGGQKPSMR